MSDSLCHAFGWICGQNLAHTWSPAGELLPLCQRCTGVYAGAFVAALLHLARRPKPTTRWLWLNGIFLLFMIPSGFYWIPQNPELRCASGILFGFGLVAFLWLTLSEKPVIGDSSKLSENREMPGCKKADLRDVRFYKIFATGLVAVLVGTPLLAEYGNAFGARILVMACIAGTLTLAGLFLANGLFLLRWLARRNSRHMA